MGNYKVQSNDTGLFQLTNPAVKQVIGERIFIVDKNIEYGIKYLKWCIDNTTKKNCKGYAQSVLKIYNNNRKVK